MSANHLAPPHRIKREILRRYLSGWERRLARVRADADAPLQLVYVDAFAGAGLARGNTSGEGLLLGIYALDALARRLTARGVANRTHTILLEEDPGTIDRILQVLVTAGMDDRVQQTRELGSLEPGGIAVMNTALAGAEEVVRFTAGATAALYLLDPAAPGRLPLEIIRALRAQEQTDALLYFPTADLHKHGRYRETPVADLPSFARRIVDGYSRLLGDLDYTWVPQWRDTERESGAEAAEAWVIKHYRQRLRALDELAAVRVCRVPLLAADEPALSLFLLTSDPGRALALNEVLYGARCDRLIAWDEVEPGIVRDEPIGALELFAGGGAEPPSGSPDPRVRQVDFMGLAHRIATHFAGRTVRLREVLLHLMDTDLFLPDVKRALSELKRDGRALYRSLASDDVEVAFPKRGSAPVRRARVRRRGDEELSLSLDLEPESDA